MALSDTLLNQNFKHYLDTVKQIQTELKTKDESAKLTSEVEILAYYNVKVKALSLLGKEKGKYDVKKNQEKLDLHHDNASFATDATLSSSKKETIKTVENMLGAKPGEVEDVTNPDWSQQANETVVKLPVLPEQQLEQDITRPELNEKTTKFFRENNVNEFGNASIPPVITEVNSDGETVSRAVKDLPQPGDKVAGHDSSIGETLSSQEAYVIGGTPNQPIQKIPKAWSTVPKGQINQLASPLDPLNNRIADMLEKIRKETPGSYKFFIEKLHGKRFSGEFFKKNPIDNTKTVIDFPNRMVFPAYIEAFNDSYDLGWSDYKFIGRGEKVYVYEETTRALTLRFWMISDFSTELLLAGIQEAKKNQKRKTDNINDTGNNARNTVFSQLDDETQLSEIQRLFPNWGDGTTPDPSFINGKLAGFVPGQISGTPEQLYERMTFLSQCCYGWYRKDGKLKEQPFIRVRIGDFFDVICKINSLNFTEDEFDMDLNPSSVGAIPIATMVDVNMTIIHEDEPSSEYRKFYHRLDYDLEVNNPNYVSPSGLETSKYKDKTLDNNSTNSPTILKNSLSEYGESIKDFPKKATAYQESLKSFDSSLKDLAGSKHNLKDFAKKERLTAALKNAKSLLEITNKMNLNSVEEPKNLIKPDAVTNFSKAQVPKSSV